MIRSLWAHLLYWVGMNLRPYVPALAVNQPVHPPLTRFQSWKKRKSEELLAASNRITEEDRQRQHLHDVYETSMYLLMRGVAHNPHRKEPK